MTHSLIPADAKVGLVLGSGGARGWAHIGVLRALCEAGIPIHFVAGTSMGALVGAAYASGNLDALEAAARGLDWRGMLYYFLEFPFSRSGLIDGTRIARFVRGSILASRIENLDPPFRAVSTNVATGAEYVFSCGDLFEAVRASIAVPGIFTPVLKGDAILVDGGIVNPLPVSVARAMGADFVIAVDITPDAAIAGRRSPNPPERAARADTGLTTVSGTRAPARLIARMNARFSEFKSTGMRAKNRWLARAGAPSILEVMDSTIRVIERTITQTRLITEPPDLLIRPIMGRLGFMEFHRAAFCIERGYETAIAALRRPAAPVAGGGRRGVQGGRHANGLARPA